MKRPKILQKYFDQLNKLNSRLALGHPECTYWSLGFIHGLKISGKISLQEKRILDKVFGYENDNCRYTIVKGALLDYGDE